MQVDVLFINPVVRQTRRPYLSSFFFFNDPPPPEIYPLSLPDALPIPRPSRETPGSFSRDWSEWFRVATRAVRHSRLTPVRRSPASTKPRNRCVPRHLRLYRRRSEEHTPELQSQSNIVCRLLLEKKKTE